MDDECGWLAQVVALSQSLSEVIHDRRLQTDILPTDQQLVGHQRLAHWCKVVAGGDWETFQTRLQWDGLAIETIDQLLQDQLPNYCQDYPRWAADLRSIVHYAKRFASNSKFVPLITPLDLRLVFPTDTDNPLPFEDVFLPILAMAQQKLFTRIDLEISPKNFSLPKMLSEAAFVDLLRRLLQVLAKLCEKTLEFEFSRFRPLGHQLLNLLFDETGSNNHREYYTAFVQVIWQDGMLNLFQDYPVLGRLIATTTDFWVDATAEFLQRLNADRTQIETLYLQGSSLGSVTAITASMSDFHNNGRTVMVCAFESGLKLVYKPRSLDLDIAYNQFLHWCNQQSRGITCSPHLTRSEEGDFQPFRVLSILNCQGYGWVEYVEHLPCYDEAAVQCFYWRAGMLLCVLYLLGATDCHSENFIANGGYPVLVDLETLMHHVPRTEHDPWSVWEAESKVYQQFKRSVLRTALLPYWDFHQGSNVAYDLSGLGSTEPQQLPWVSSKWRAVNTDEMHLEYGPVIKPTQKNVVLLNGVIKSPNDYLEDVCFGFQRMYLLLMKGRDDLLAASSPLSLFKGLKARFIFRPTRDYALIMLHTLAPDFLRCGINRSIELDILSQVFLTSIEQPMAWPVFHAEVSAMEQLDVPYFQAYTDREDLLMGVDQRVQQYFLKPSYSHVLDRVQELNETDLTQQVDIIRGAFCARAACPLQLAVGETLDSEPAAVSEFGSIAEQWPVSACAIAQEICDRAIIEANGSIHWIGLSNIPKLKRFQFQILDVNLYNGNCGIALFLAALDNIRNRKQFLDLVLGALQPIRHALHRGSDPRTARFSRSIGIGGGTGLGSIIYTFVRIARWLQEPSLIEDALYAAHYLTPELIAADRQLDVISGAAGAVLGLLVLHQEVADPAILHQADICGQHLLKNHLGVNRSSRAWTAIDQQPLNGFMHGTAGIAYALLRLFQITHDTNYLEAAREGIAHECTVFSQSALNQIDLPSSNLQASQSSFINNQCYGVRGIELGCLGSLSILDSEEINQQVMSALQVITTLQDHVQGGDSLCYGSLGQCEFLLVAAQKLSRPDLCKIARRKAAGVVARAKQAGAYQLFADLPCPVFSPGFFHGTSGIGYELLRLAKPEALPSVLLWE